MFQKRCSTIHFFMRQIQAIPADEIWNLNSFQNFLLRIIHTLYVTYEVQFFSGFWRAAGYWKKITTLLFLYSIILSAFTFMDSHSFACVERQPHVADWLIIMRNIKCESFLSNTITFVFRTKITCPPSIIYMQIFESNIKFSLQRASLLSLMAWSPETFPLAARICDPLPPSCFPVPLLLERASWFRLWGRTLIKTICSHLSQELW